MAWTLEQIEDRCRTADDGQPCDHARMDDVSDRVIACDLICGCRHGEPAARPCSQAYRSAAMSPGRRCPHPSGDHWSDIKPLVPAVEMQERVRACLATGDAACPSHGNGWECQGMTGPLIVAIRDMTATCPLDRWPATADRS